MKSLDDVVMRERVVFLRADFNVPLDENKKVADDTRIRATLPTIEKILNSGAYLLIASHLGRPKGKAKPEFSLRPVCDHLSSLLGREVTFVGDCVGDERQKALERAKPGDCFLLENVRFHEGETKNDPEFARALADGVDVYVNDAFAVSHRAHASVHGIVKYVKECAAGYQLQKELEYYHKALVDPKRPVVFIVGGAKVSTKIGVLENLTDRCDKMLIGGAMANTFLKAMGKSVGASMVEDDFLEGARSFLDKAEKAGLEVILPVDGRGVETGGNVVKEIKLEEITPNFEIYDIGSGTVEAFKRAIADAATIIWNGPVGMFEKEDFAMGTFEMARIVADSRGLKVAGGGDTVSALRKSGTYDRFDYVSTGGGAFLELLEGKTLPGVAALDECGK